MQTQSSLLPTVQRKAWRFFLDNAGYATPPGRAACALSLARSERESYARGWTVSWGADSFCDCETYENERVGYVPMEGPCDFAELLDEQGEVLASLYGIHGADQSYRRVVAAELAAEAIAAGK